MFKLFAAVVSLNYLNSKWKRYTQERRDIQDKLIYQSRFKDVDYVRVNTRINAGFNQHNYEKFYKRDVPICETEVCNQIFRRLDNCSACQKHTNNKMTFEKKALAQSISEHPLIVARAGVMNAVVGVAGVGASTGVAGVGNHTTAIDTINFKFISAESNGFASINTKADKCSEVEWQIDIL